MGTDFTLQESKFNIKAYTKCKLITNCYGFGKKKVHKNNSVPEKVFQLDWFIFGEESLIHHFNDHRRIELFNSFLVASITFFFPVLIFIWKRECIEILFWRYTICNRTGKFAPWTNIFTGKKDETTCFQMDRPFAILSKNNLCPVNFNF